jgi:hypothetical protein
MPALRAFWGGFAIGSEFNEFDKWANLKPRVYISYFLSEVSEEPCGANSRKISQLIPTIRFAIVLFQFQNGLRQPAASCSDDAGHRLAEMK